MKTLLATFFMARLHVNATHIYLINAAVKPPTNCVVSQELLPGLESANNRQSLGKLFGFPADKIVLFMAILLFP